MLQLPGPRWAALISLSAALAAHAQQASAPARPASAAAAPVPGAAAGDVSYRSAFEGYQAFADEKPGSWREANDNVGRIGGWREYAREAQGGAPSPAAQPPERPASAPAAAPASPATGQNPHAGHGKH
jgi:hypothetical protein